MSFLKRYQALAIESAITQGKDIAIPGWYHQYKNIDKFYDKEKGYYHVQTQCGTSGVTLNEATDDISNKDVEIPTPFVVENDLEKYVNKFNGKDDLNELSKTNGKVHVTKI